MRLAGQRIGRLRQAQGTVERHDPATGARAQVDAHLPQCGMHPELAQFRVRLEAPNRRHCPEVGFPCRLLRGMRLVGEAREVLSEEPVEGLVDAGAGGLQIAGDRSDVPALEIEVDDGEPTLGRVGNLGVGGITPPPERGQRPLGQDALDRLMAHSTIVPSSTDRGDLVWAERRVLGLQRQDAMPQVSRHPTAVIVGPRSGREEAGHPLGVEAVRLAVERALRDTGGLGPLGGRLPKEHDGPQQFVGLLLGELHAQPQLLPVVRRLAPDPFRYCHRHHRPRRNDPSKT